MLWALQVLAELDRLRVQLHRSPTTAELATRLHTTEELIAEAIQAATTRMIVSLDRPLADDGQSSVSLADTLAAAAPAVERRTCLCSHSL